ncbi:MAG TPA: hypothetical protein VMZ28_20200 [Kofleriaceae bacterium]|nr:hypothetical protein [Kofleriaceae bacterium]
MYGSTRPSLLAACAALAACGFDADYGTGYRCIDDGDCPDGQLCVENSCQVPAPGGRDAAVIDARLDNAGADAATDAAPTNLLEDPGFEVVNDQDWEKYNSTLAKNLDDPHGGSSFGRVCVINAEEEFTVFQPLEGAPPQGARYEASVWMRADETPVTVMLTIREGTGPSFVDHDGQPIELGTSWQQLSHSATVEETGRTFASFIVWGLTGGGTCYQIDDAFAYRAGS